MNRRDVLQMTMSGTLLTASPRDTLAQAPRVAPELPGRTGRTWDRGRLLHLPPTVSDREMLIKASFDRPLTVTPSLRVGSLAVTGRMSNSHGELRQFHAKGLEPVRRYRLSLIGGSERGGTAPCERRTRLTSTGHRISRRHKLGGHSTYRTQKNYSNKRSQLFFMRFQA